MSDLKYLVLKWRLSEKQAPKTKKTQDFTHLSPKIG